MVFFTCNHCGEAVKKPSVEKHYNTKCRGAPKSISCMDCQTDFQDNYVEHTKCITEMEKYSGKDYVPRESQNSGARKQEGWTEVVRSVLDNGEYQLTAETRKAFLTLQNYDNIPRKKPKFLNFVTNSVRLPRKTVEEVWNILEKEQEKMKQARQAQLKAVENGKELVGNEENKSKQDASNAVADSEKEMVEGIENGKANEAKKKKKKHRDIEIESDSTEVGDDIAGNGDSEDTEKENEKTKKQKKNKKSVEQIEPLEAIQQNGRAEDTKKKKQKKKNQNETETNDVNNATETPSKKQKKIDDNPNNVSSDQTQSKKKKHKAEDEPTAKEPAKKKQKIKGATQENSEDTYRFCWDTELARITGKHPEGITMEKLKKKILKKFKTKFAESELSERQQKGFEKKLNKKLKSNASLQLDGDLIKAC